MTAPTADRVLDRMKAFETTTGAGAPASGGRPAGSRATGPGPADGHPTALTTGGVSP